MSNNAKKPTKIIAPQQGFQFNFLSSDADIKIGGSGAGVGKTFALLIDAIRYMGIKGFGGTIFRRTTPEITGEGGLWDASLSLFLDLKGAPTPIASKNKWVWANRNKLDFRHLEHEKDVYNYQGLQFPFIGFDELTHFTRKQFFYLLSRSRSTCGVNPYISATCNPESHGWVKEFVQWWIYPDDYPNEELQGMAIPERAGVKRYFITDDEKPIWGSSYEEVMVNAPHIFTKALLDEMKRRKQHPSVYIKSVAFIPGSIYDNKALIESNPQYIANLMAQPKEVRVQLLGGCWKMLKGEDILFHYSELKCLFTNEFVRNEKADMYMTCDIALEGADKFVMMIWQGLAVLHIETVDKSTGKKVVELIRELSRQWRVPNRNIIFDADGVGGFLGGKDGYLSGAVSFHGAAAPVSERLDRMSTDTTRPAYENLRTQCYYELAERVNDCEIYIATESGSLQTAIVEELFQTRKRPYNGQKLQIMPKAEIKGRLRGKSPDFADALMMRMWFEIVPRRIGGIV